MDRQYSKAFFKSFVDAIQRICREFLDFEQSVELCGYISLEIDNYRKERYVLSELIQNAGGVISESYCTKSFRTVRTENQNVGVADQNRVPMSSATLSVSGKPSRRDVKLKNATSEVSVTHNTYPTSYPVHSKAASKQKQTNSQVFVPSTGQLAPHNEFGRHYSSVGDPVPVQLFTSVTNNEDPRGTVGRKCTQLKVPSFESFTSDHGKMTHISSQTKRKAAAGMSTGAKRIRESSPLDSTPGSFQTDVPHTQDAADSSDSCSVVIKEEGVPFMVIHPETDTSSGEGFDQDISQGATSGDSLGQFLEAAMTEDMNHNTSRKTRGHVKLFQEYLGLRGIDTPMQALAPEKLDKILSSFFWDIKKENGEEYEPSYLKNMQSSLERHLKMSGYKFCITRDKYFETSRQKLKDKQSELIQKGKGNVPNKIVFLTDQDVDHLFKTKNLGDHNPEVLVNTVWLFMNIHFGSFLKNVRDHCDLLWKDVQLGVDNSGKEFLVMEKGTSYIRVGTQDATPNRCLVKMYKKYRTLRQSYTDDNCPFYLYPNNIQQDETNWYKLASLGANRLNGMVRRIVEGSGLPMEKKYTNSSAQVLVRGAVRNLVE